MLEWTADMTNRRATTVEVNGFAVREIRILAGIEIAQLAQEAQISRPYLAHLELGSRIRVSPTVFNRLQSALQLTDRRAILANPHAQAGDAPKPLSEHLADPAH